jgi:nitroreductase
MLSVVEAIRQRRSVRAFQSREVPAATLHEIFALAQQAPSNCNTQPWLVHVVSGAKCNQLRQQLLQAGMDPTQYQPDFPYDGRYPGVYKERQHDAAAQLYGAMEIARDDKAGRGRAALRNYAFFDAPHAAFVFLPEPFGVREAADCGIYAQTLMLLLTAHGLASCPQAALSFHPRIVREALGLPDNLRLLFGVSFGYEDTDAPANRCRVGRAELDAAVSFHL